MKLSLLSNTRLLILGTLIVTGLMGCASVSVYKLGADGKIAEGTPEGLRFYMPRPYVSVFEPFIAASDVYLAKGELSPDGNHILLTQVPQGLDAIVNHGLQSGASQSMGRLVIDSSQVIARGSLTSGGPQSTAAGDAQDGKPKNGKTADSNETDGKKAAPKKGDAENASPPPTTAGGVLNYKALNDNSAFAITPQPRYFNILWLPDFDEKYVITAKAGLGNAGVTINFGQGWSLQGLEAKIDNSAVLKPLFDFYSATLGALQKLTTAKIQAPLAALTGGPQSAQVTGEKTAKSEFQGGTPVTVKVTKVRIVAPGLYPILKPGETAQLTPEEQKRILDPKPPLTNVAFNTYDAIVIEAARSTGDAALRIHQYVDSTVSGRAGDPPPTTSDAGSGADLKEAASKLNVELSRPENVSKAGQFYLATLNRADGVVKVQLRVRPGGSGGTLDALPDQAAIKGFVVSKLKALSSIEVLPDNISVAK